MRRILVLAFAVAATFSVLANNFIPVSAPAAFGELAVWPAGPTDAARLSDQSIAPMSTAVVPAVSAPGPDLSDQSVHITGERQSETTAVTAQQPPVSTYIHAQAYRPSNAIIRRKLEALPKPIEVGDALASIVFDHSSSVSISVAADRAAFAAESASIRDLTGLNNEPTEYFAVRGASVGSERSQSDPERVRIAPTFIPLAAQATNIFKSLTARPLSELPSILPEVTVLGESAANHSASSAATAGVAEREAFVVDTARLQQPVTAMFVKASYDEPASIFHRARFVAEPNAPVPTNALSAVADAHTEIAFIEDAAERSSFSADRAMVREPAFVQASSALPSVDFVRERLVSLPEAPVSTQVLADASSHAVADSPVASIERSSAIAEAAPKAAYVPTFIETIAEVPTAIFQRIGLVAMPEAPATVETLTDAAIAHASSSGPTGPSPRETMVPDAVRSAAVTPVDISASTAMSSAMLKPMSAGPLVDAPMLNENAVASNGSAFTGFDRMIDSPDVPEAVLKARPVTISGKAEFSADLLKPLNAPINPFQKLDNAEVAAAMLQINDYCNPNFVGPPIRFSQTVELKLDDLLRQLHQRFGVNFIVGKGVADLPMNIKAGSIPWNVLLRSQLFISGVRARCIDGNTIELVENQELPRLQDGADVETRFVKLKFLQRTSSGSVDLAGRGQGGGGQNGQGGGCSSGGGSGGGLSGGGSGGSGGGQQSETAAQQTSSKFDKLIIEIEKILGLRSMTESTVGGGGSQGGQAGGQGQAQTTEAVRTNRFVTQIPGRNILAIRATKEEHDLIDQIIVRADRPPFQVVVKGLVYTANQDKLRDIGVSTSIFGGTADGRTSGSIVGNTLGAAGTIFDFSTIIGTFDFNVQATALEQSGVLSVKSRPFSTVIDGLCARLNVGRSIPIIIDSSLGGQGALEFIDALNKLDVTPHVIDDENGNPVAVTLELTMFANDVDNSVIARGVPAVSERSIQTQLLLAEDKTAILGGFTVDQASRTVEKTPGIGDIPIIGELFKRRVNDKRVNRLYFAISVDVIPYPEAIRPVDVPGATTDIPSITPEQKKRADAAEPKQVKGP